MTQEEQCEIIPELGGDAGLSLALMKDAIMVAAKLRRLGLWDEDPCEMSDVSGRGWISPSLATVVAVEADFWRGNGPEIILAFASNSAGVEWDRPKLIKVIKELSLCLASPSIEVSGGVWIDS